MNRIPADTLRKQVVKLDEVWLSTRDTLGVPDLPHWLFCAVVEVAFLAIDHLEEAYADRDVAWKDYSRMRADRDAALSMSEAAHAALDQLDKACAERDEARALLDEARASAEAAAREAAHLETLLTETREELNAELNAVIDRRIIATDGLRRVADLLLAGKADEALVAAVTARRKAIGLDPLDDEADR